MRVGRQILGFWLVAVSSMLMSDAEPQSLPVDHGTVIVPTLSLWGLLAF